MRFEPRLDGGEEGDSRPLLHRIGWMLLLWLGGIAAVGIVAIVIRSWLQ